MVTLGIDISKDKFDATVIDENGKFHHRKFKNNEKGFKQLQKWLSKLGVTETLALMKPPMSIGKT